MRAAAILAAAIAIPLASVPLAAEAPAGTRMSCDDGQITKKIAGAKWKMRGCSDGHSLIFVFKEKDANKMAILAFNYGPDGYELAAYGKTDQPEFRAAADWAQSLSVREIEALYAETQAKKKR